MARPIKTGLDYFPLDVDMDEKIELIEAKHGLLGFGLVIKLFQRIYKKGYYFNVTEDKLLLIKKQLNVDINFINDCINDSCHWGVFHSDLFSRYKILTSKGIQKRFIEATKRRSEISFIQEYLLVSEIQSYYKDGVNVDINSINADNNSINTDISTHSKVKKSKEKKSKEKNLSFKTYLKTKIQENNFTESEDKIFEFYNYRMDMVISKRYKNEKGINGLFRDLNNCNEAGLNIPECLEIAMEKNWMTLNPSWFKNLNNKRGKLNGTTKNFTGNDTRDSIIPERLPKY